jgi:hypothetical protein
MELSPELLHTTGWILILVYVVSIVRLIFWGPEA